MRVGWSIRSKIKAIVSEFEFAMDNSALLRPVINIAIVRLCLDVHIHSRVEEKINEMEIRLKGSYSEYYPILRPMIEILKKSYPSCEDIVDKLHEKMLRLYIRKLSETIISKILMLQISDALVEYILENVRQYILAYEALACANEVRYHDMLKKLEKTYLDKVRELYPMKSYEKKVYDEIREGSDKGDFKLVRYCKLMLYMEQTIAYKVAIIILKEIKV